MAKGDGNLNARRVATISDPGRYTDGRGLHLFVRPNGSKSWVLRQTPASRRRDFVPGSPAGISLADVRATASEWRKMIADETDPIAERAERRSGKPEIQTFEDAAKAFRLKPESFGIPMAV